MFTNSVRFDPGFDSVLQGGVDTSGVAVVAGGAGFIGSNLIWRLLGDGYQIVCLDNLETGRHENISELLTNPDFKFFLHDIIKPFHVTGRVDRIYNLACPASPPKYQKDPVHTFLTSVVGALNILQLADAKEARVLQSSTSEVYGDPDVTPQSEVYRGLVSTVGPRACYDEGKRAAETLFHDMHETKGVDVRISRIFNTYGPRMDPEDGRVVSNFVMQALRGEALTIYGTGGQTRSFCYIDDMVNALIAHMEAEDIDFDPINLGNPDEFTIIELAQLVRDFIPEAQGVVFHGLPKDDPKQRCPDITRAKTLLHWEPNVSLRDGLEPTIKYFRNELAQSQSFGGGQVSTTGTGG
ncbi:UDP-glucuronate decarboxylase [Shimia gijangensis]|uniref:UDP-glucuronate decarboxylase n=1 Tax=Shimia gijangensis TaxID=1470563 RepID=A0A1M6D9T5_9RHOB|nr:UDP-glucuronic acid decarboxylase family protein [Shimia gijangensis]SHI69768.1 UDP-glucuronate decarboxylase [Shimia gijangensis]